MANPLLPDDLWELLELWFAPQRSLGPNREPSDLAPPSLDEHSVGRPAPRDELWQWQDLLATPARLATRRHLAQESRRAAEALGRGGQVGLVPSGHRFFVGGCGFGAIPGPPHRSRQKWEQATREGRCDWYSLSHASECGERARREASVADGGALYAARLRGSEALSRGLAVRSGLRLPRSPRAVALDGDGASSCTARSAERFRTASTTRRRGANPCCLASESTGQLRDEINWNYIKPS